MKRPLRKSVLCSLVAASLSLIGYSASAADLEWSGVYRIEGYHIKNSEVDNRDRQKDYGLHHLVLRPKIIAMDGVTIQGRFDIFNNANFENSQLGQIFGSGDTDQERALADQQQSEELKVTHLYVTWTQEFGALVAGRTPLHFGLGMSHNAGNGLFDHWFDTRDMVAYKLVMGNIFLMPMLAKVNEGTIQANDDITDYMIQAQYENLETNLEMGAFYQVRKANSGANDFPVDPPGGTGAQKLESLDRQELGIFVERDNETWRLGIEGAFQSGKTGVYTQNDTEVSLGGYGVAVEFDYRPEGSAIKYGVRTGFASGDDPESDGKYEGYLFDRNYDVAFLLFNHPLGQYNLFNTELIGGGPQGGVAVGPDTEAIGNVIYLSPRLDYQWTDTLSVFTSITTGWSDQAAVADAEKDLGYEWDIALTYEPREGVQWVNQVGLLFPGAAFEGGGQYKAAFAYGIGTKAAISF